MSNSSSCLDIQQIPNPSRLTVDWDLLFQTMCKSVRLKKWEKEDTILKNVKQFRINSMWRHICRGKTRYHTRTALIYAGLFKLQQYKMIISRLYRIFHLFVFHFKISVWLESEFSGGETLKKWGVQSLSVCALFVCSPHKKASIVVCVSIYDTK